MREDFQFIPGRTLLVAKVSNAVLQKRQLHMLGRWLRLATNLLKPIHASSAMVRGKIVV